MEHIIEKPDPNVNLLERILSRENMRQAWKRVKANKGVAGIDGMSIEEFPEFAQNHWTEIRQTILDGRYQPKPVLRVEIPKATGGTRQLGIPTVMDRVIQQAVAQVLTPIFDPEFSESSYGFRPGRSAHDAVRKVRGYIAEGYKVAVDMDLSKFFDTVNHDVLMHRVRMCYWRQGRFARTKVRNLLKLGVSKRAAIPIAMSRKGPWNLSRTLATQAGMTNKWLMNQGQVSIKEMWVNIHYPATAR